MIRCDIKFAFDSDNNYVFSLYPDFETLSDEYIVGDEWEALDVGTAIIRKPIYEKNQRGQNQRGQKPKGSDSIEKKNPSIFSNL